MMNLACSRVRIGTNNLAGKGCGLQIKPIVRFLTGIGPALSSVAANELERYMRCRQCSEVRGSPYKRSHLVALRPTKISANDPASTWWPGER
jgi:hypothetical protein